MQLANTAGDVCTCVVIGQEGTMGQVKGIMGIVFFLSQEKHMEWQITLSKMY